MIKVVVVDDHALFRAGLVGLLGDMPGIQVVGEASNGSEALEVVKSKKPDVVLMDVNMPVMNGVESLIELRRTEKCRIIMLTISKQESDLFDAITAGADGYLLKNAEPEELKKAIHKVVEGNAVLSPEVTQPIIRAIANMSLATSDKGISPREVEILECLADGLTTSQIAFTLFISENTVKTHIRHILEKLEASNRTEAVSKASQLGLIRK
jgi:DNA-binding NarL/FixJ family response regulator